MKSNPDVSGKKLLLIGALESAADLLDLCHRNHVSLGMTDFNENSYVKTISDGAYYVDALNIDELVRLCDREGFDGVITEYVDRLLPIAADVADEIGAYSPFTKEQIRMSTDKDFFKHTCMRYGVPVPRLYEGDFSDVEFPVLVKPVDNSSSRGLCVCNNMEELQEGLQEAKKSSHSGRVIVEAYLPYDEINVTYVAQDGDIQLAAIHDRYFNTAQEGLIKTPDMYIYPSRYTDLYYKTVNDKVINMLKEIGVKNGSLFMQAVVHDGRVYFYEAGMRLNGCKTYEILEYENDYNTQEHLMYYCLTGDMGEHRNFDARFGKWYATWNVVGLPGRKVAKFVNREAFSSYPWLIKFDPNYAVGDKIREHTEGTLLQLVGRVHIMADNKEQLYERIQKLYDLLDVVDENGESIILPGHDVEDIKKRLDYEL